MENKKCFYDKYPTNDNGQKNDHGQDNYQKNDHRQDSCKDNYQKVNQNVTQNAYNCHGQVISFVASNGIRYRT